MMSEYFKRETLEKILDKTIKEFDNTERKVYSEVIKDFEGLVRVFHGGFACVAGKNCIEILRDMLGKIPADRVDDVESVPSADVAQVKHGKWLSMDSERVIAMDDDGCPVETCYCSECGDWLTGSDEYMVRGRYCPNCGAKMEGKSEQKRGEKEA